MLVDGLRMDKKARRDSEFTLEMDGKSEIQPIAEVTSLLSHLPESQRKAVELRYVDEKTFEEIAQILNTTSINARKIISRAVAKLKSFAEQKGD